MATLSIGKAHFTIGAHSNHYSEVGNQDRPGFMANLYRFMSSVQEAADKYSDYRYN